jgi:UPF0755 protein
MKITPEQESEHVLFRRRFLTPGKFGLAVLLFIAVIFYNLFAAAPLNFPAGKVASVKEGSSAAEISRMLAKEGIIRSSGVLDAILFVSGKQTGVNAGSYFFPKPVNVFTVARRISLAEFNITPVRVTITEGTASFDIPKIFSRGFYNFDGVKFLELAEPKEGYLFPDTYLFYPNVSPEEVIKVLTGTFNTKIKDLEGEIKDSDKSLHDIVVMASIIELEASKPEDRRLISGILWKRISIGMALQVDAPFAYISDKSTYDLTAEDLKQDSPYNTYNRTGLPPGAICNPGMDAIMAAIYPKSSPYLYYLSDRSGNVYYAEDFEEHKRNKIKYL